MVHRQNSVCSLVPEPSRVSSSSPEKGGPSCRQGQVAGSPERLLLARTHGPRGAVGGI